MLYDTDKIRSMTMATNAAYNKAEKQLFLLRGKMLRYAFLVIFALAAVQVSGQKESGIWYFGSTAGLSFLNGPPVALTDGQLNTLEGCATIADANGQLLFYTDGIRVWDRSHAIMATDLLGDPSSTQSGVIVPKPGSSTIFYIFTVANNAEPDGICYSIVDMTMNGGMGALTLKNIFLKGPVTEKITAVRHRNNIDTWVITHDWDNADFLCYLVTPSGVSSPPVVSKIGSVHSGTSCNSMGYLKTSFDGNKLALAVSGCASPTGEDRVEIFDFDNSSGIVSNPFLDYVPNAYGIEFSPNARFLYVSAWYSEGKIYQYDLNAGSETAVRNSKTIVGKVEVSGSTVNCFGALQIGPDGVIYVVKNAVNTMSSINDPDLPGLQCNFKDNSVNLGPERIGQLGLPTFIQSFFYNAEFTFTGLCGGVSTVFKLNMPNKPDSVKWNFGDPASGVQNISRLSGPSHVFSSPGKYKVVLTAYFERDWAIFFREIEIIANPDISLPKDTFICGDEPIVIVAEIKNASTIQWQDGSFGSKLTVTKPGIYWARATNGACTDRDTIIISSVGTKLNLGKVLPLCQNTKLLLSAGALRGTYVWQDGSYDSIYHVGEPGLYWVQVTNSCGVFSDTVRVFTESRLVVDLGPDTIICDERGIVINAGVSANKYVWSTGDSVATIRLTDPGVYWIDVTNACETKRDSIRIWHSTFPAPNLGKDTTICDGDSILLNVKEWGVRYAWQDGSVTPAYIVKKAGTYHVRSTNDCGSKSDTVKISTTDCRCYMFIPNAFTPNDDTLNHTFKPQSCPYRTFKMVIYNRWGERLFETENMDIGWDGKFRGQIVQEGMYIYKIYAFGINNSRNEYSGHFYVLK
ncbi:MAG: gliding motility-associated C-terminal domain-containing protein [Bacteroidota bacterium]|nr:gliding motility-associated C-terminal domain-containing protein [Bacteroidota bacterium]